MMAADFPNLDPGIEIVASTTGMSKGIEQADGPQVIVKGLVKAGDLQLAAQWKNVSVYPADGEASVSAGLSHKWGWLQLSGGLAYKALTNVSGSFDDQSLEATAAAAAAFGKASIKASAIYSPDDFGPTRQSLYVEAGPAIRFGKGWTASAAVGHRGRERGLDYTSFNAGLSKSVRFLQLDLRFYDTDRHGAGQRYDSRIVGSVKLSF